MAKQNSAHFGDQQNKIQNGHTQIKKKTGIRCAEK